jgi:DNA-binding response OmpR family regulator
VEAAHVLIPGLLRTTSPNRSRRASFWRELALLRVLAERHGCVIPRRKLLHAVWRAEVFADDRVLDVYVRTLRKKVEPDPPSSPYVVTVRGIGHRLEAPATEAIASWCSWGMAA